MGSGAPGLDMRSVGRVHWAGDSLQPVLPWVSDTQPEPLVRQSSVPSKCHWFPTRTTWEFDLSLGSFCCTPQSEELIFTGTARCWAWVPDIRPLIHLYLVVTLWGRWITLACFSDSKMSIALFCFLLIFTISRYIAELMKKCISHGKLHAFKPSSMAHKLVVCYIQWRNRLGWIK